ncbi:hypothetical protein M0R45_013233 [Rubus argutus]|uniref:Uncharacterized protein n=1 Tax=Rubus argutus TaxID=59490 RepID=A0AAW1XK01_RUBAR
MNERHSSSATSSPRHHGYYAHPVAAPSHPPTHGHHHRHPKPHPHPPTASPVHPPVHPPAHAPAHPPTHHHHAHPPSHAPAHSPYPHAPVQPPIHPPTHHAPTGSLPGPSSPPLPTHQSTLSHVASWRFKASSFASRASTPASTLSSMPQSLLGLLARSCSCRLPPPPAPSLPTSTGLSGAVLRPTKPFLSDKKLPFLLYTVGPFAFESKCPR